MSNYELSIFKLAVSLLSMVIGAYFACYLRPFLLPMLVVGSLLAVWATIAWWKGMDQEQY
ncbi:MAG: hypothetical protein Q8T09_12710 [Candidatus Melainabacteria bacterium]|nr:hypothetical protein [Candidatus Melainabacteria bacterium]